MAVKRALPRPVPGYPLAGVQVAVYAFRLFGTPTVLLGLELPTHRCGRLRDG
ncbi:hypothetical protein AB0L74_19285 [Streptomyces sp. NPDC052020]|uniref:hypothetical protein n=1 Tax=Streptomyces sp. NPDC052020 TaxID=3155677 RepID=UPI0034316B66